MKTRPDNFSNRWGDRSPNNRTSEKKNATWACNLFITKTTVLFLVQKLLDVENRASWREKINLVHVNGSLDYRYSLIGSAHRVDRENISTKNETENIQRKLKNKNKAQAGIISCFLF